MSVESPPALSDIDLKLLVVLNALLEERSVTRTATALGVSVSAVSAALKRLRRHFDDELLHRDGNQYQLTGFATEIRDEALHALSVAAELLGCRAPAEPGPSVPHLYSVLVPAFVAAKYRSFMPEDGPELVVGESDRGKARVLHGLSTLLTRRPELGYLSLARTLEEATRWGA